MNADKVTILAVGDIIPDWPNPEELFEPALPALKKADIRFAQLEANLSLKGEAQLHNPSTRRVAPEKVSCLKKAGFDVMSFASNHHLDQGEAALFETMDTMKKANIPLIGVGRNIDEARKPLILERKGVKIAFLAYCSVLPKGYEATTEKSGCAPMRTHTFYEPMDWQPATPPRIVSFADKDDLAALVEDIKKVRKQADVVIMCIHWGVHFVPAVIADYQREVGHAAIDAGADVILGGHAHILKGTEVYKGKVIFYSLCNFIMPGPTGRVTTGKKLYGIKDDPEYPNYAFPVDSRKSLIAKISIANKKIDRVSFLPMLINKKTQPVVQQRKDEGFDQVRSYMKEITDSQGLNAKYEADGDEVVIHS